MDAGISSAPLKVADARGCLWIEHFNFGHFARTSERAAKAFPRHAKVGNDRIALEAVYVDVVVLIVGGPIQDWSNPDPRTLSHDGSNMPHAPVAFFQPNASPQEDAIVPALFVFAYQAEGPGAKMASAAAPSPAVVQAENFVERSKVLLLGLVNYDPATEDAYAFNLNGKKAMSRTLAAEAPAIRSGLNERGQQRLRGLVADLEVILMQIANLEAGQDLEGVDLIKQGVDRKGIFLKIDLDRMGRDFRGQAAPSGVAPGPKKSKI